MSMASSNKQTVNMIGKHATRYSQQSTCQHSRSRDWYFRDMALLVTHSCSDRVESTAPISQKSNNTQTTKGQHGDDGAINANAQTCGKIRTNLRWGTRALALQNQMHEPTTTHGRVVRQDCNLSIWKPTTNTVVAAIDAFVDKTNC